MRILLLFTMMFSIKTIAKLQRRIMTLNNNRSTAYWAIFGGILEKNTIPKEKYLPAKELKFKGTMFKVPNDFDYILRKLYGDYMILPRIEQRVGSHLIEVKFNTN